MAMPSYPAATMAKLLMLTPRRLQQLATEGIIPKVERGRYELAPVVQAYIHYLRERAVPGAMNVVSIDEARQRKLLADARLAEIEVAKAEGAVASIAAVEKGWTVLVHTLRGRLLALPQHIAAMVAVETEIAKCEALIASQIKGALSELGETKLQDIEDRTGEPARGAGAGAAHDASASRSQHQRVGRPRKGAVAGS